MAGSLTDIFAAMQNGVVALGNLRRQIKGSFNNILGQLNAITANARIRLTAGLTLFVATTGSDANNGLSAATPFLTISHALAILSTKYDVDQQAVAIQCADGTYNENILFPNILGAAVGGGLGSNNPTLQGNITTPANCILNGSGGNATILIVSPSINDWIVRGFKVTNGGTGFAIEADAGSWIRLGEMEYGSVGGATHFMSLFGSTIEAMADYKISAGTATHIQTSVAGRFVIVPGKTVTLSSTPNFTSMFTFAVANSVQEWTGTTFSGAATGTRFFNDTGGGLKTGGGGVNFFPGNVAGTTTAPGWYS